MTRPNIFSPSGECLNVCAWNTSCTGVTLRYRKNAATDICLFAATPLAKNNLTSVTNESRTFLKCTLKTRDNYNWNRHEHEIVTGLNKNSKQLCFN